MAEPRNKRKQACQEHPPLETNEKVIMKKTRPTSYPLSIDILVRIRMNGPTIAKWFTGERPSVQQR